MAQLSSRQRTIFLLVIGLLVLVALGGGTYAVVNYREQQARTSLVTTGAFNPTSLPDIITSPPPPTPAPAPTPSVTPTPTPTPVPAPTPTPTVTAPPRVTTPVVAAPRRTNQVVQAAPTAVATGTGDNLTVANGTSLPGESPEAGIGSGILVALAAIASLTIMAVFAKRQSLLDKA